MPESTKRSENKTRRYQSIVQTAEMLFLEHGLDQVQMQDVADKEEIGIATLFRYFPKKDRLIVAVASHNLEKHVSSFFEIVYEDIPAYDRLIKLFDLLTIDSSDTLSKSAVFREAFESYASFSQEPLDTIQDYIDTQKRVADLVLHLIDEGIQDKSFRTDVPVKETIITAINSYGTFGSNITLKSPITYLEEDIAPHRQQQRLKEMLLSYVKGNEST
ncbi:TetR/AcrR family transcriptional regulator [Alkalihalobacillus sp. LMS6]|uniref:TetR/AcrR family transcriptional regulator n=1 Tax=Alkalihalobacillus sp. LMS6 TaxID=2924034 RepID=UPI0020D03A9E|nr:TetR/AcrR family transcriptional regulator [Alkalihalobacillus sp. LMS6]UTR07216.1 TetR/AcrR family transcriptional regulator [Alkalihalobacillus sp. LMS6]